MNDVLLRPIFRKKYLDEQKSKNKFNKGGLANIQKFQQGGLSVGEKRAIKLAPFVTALTGAQTRPGESELSSLARAFGQGFAGLPEATKSIAAIESVSGKEGKGPFRLLSREEVLANTAIIDKNRTYQEDLSSGKISPVGSSPQTQISIGDKATKYQEKKATKDAEYTTQVETQATTSVNNLDDLNTLMFLSQNPDLTFGQFGEFAAGAEKLARGFGLTFGQDTPAAELFTKLGGSQVLAGLANFKGAISNAEREYVASLMPQLSRSREGVIGMLTMQKKLEERNIKLNDFMQDWLAKNDPENKGPSFARDAQGDNYYRAQAEWLKQNPIFDEDFANQLTILSKKVDPNFSSALINKDGKLYLRVGPGEFVPYQIRKKAQYEF
jgi:hypothetical protein